VSPVTRSSVLGFNRTVLTDASLVRRVLEGDTAAFTTLVDRHAAACTRFATRMLGNREDAEDATQETFLRAYRSLGRYEERQTFRTWLFQILVNRCRTAAVRRQRRQRMFLLDDNAVASASVRPAADASDLRAELQRAIETLDADQREAFLLKHVEQLSYDEMAAATGVGVSALKMRVKRACDRMQWLLREVSDVGT
jgi:RNA polymerase sigma-70 factor (ECF subfamily)